jgi:hypothetical protein
MRASHALSHKKYLNDDRDYLERLIGEHEAADFLGYSSRALQNWRLRGGGPRFVCVSRRSIRYRRRDLIEWAEGRLHSSTSEAAGRW